MTKNKDTFYITTTLPYVNADPHIGFALEIVQADVIARYMREQGKEVFFNTGVDEHGIKIYRKAQEQGISVMEYVDGYAKRFDSLKEKLNLSYNNFIRTTDKEHMAAAQEFWNRCLAKGDIYKKNYEVKYCVGCELEKTDSELDDGKCPDHPTTELEIIKEENYFFKFSKYTDKLLRLYESNPDFVLPKSRLKEIRTFVEGGLQDFSISRVKEKMPWGVPVPDDDSQVMYVWFDALVNYISAIGWPNNMEEFEKWWPTVQLAGKDNLRQQSAMWQAMLMSADIPESKQILIHGFITSDGKKMSKSVGNVINPFDVVDAYGTDALRYYLIREIAPFEDSDFTDDKFKEAYNANLANGIGNLVARTIKMSHTYFDGHVKKGSTYDVELISQKQKVSDFVKGIESEYKVAMDSFKFNEAADAVWKLIGELDGYIAEYQPYKLVKTDKEKTENILWNILSGLHAIADMLTPLLPDTSKKIKQILNVDERLCPEEFCLLDIDKHLFNRIES